MFRDRGSWRKVFSIPVGLALLPLLVSCGQTPALKIGGGEEAGQPDQWVDWAELDHCLSRSQLIKDYIYSGDLLKPDDPLQEYLAATTPILSPATPYLVWSCLLYT